MDTAFPPDCLMRFGWAAWLPLLLLFVGSSAALHPAQAAAQDALVFTPQEIERILAHGPWPPPVVRDPSNRVSGNARAVALGERLFFSPRLSGTGGVLCASCHEPWRAYTDGRSRGVGVEPGERNTQSVVNVRVNRWFGWDGANDNLWAQSIRPLLAQHEMRSSAAHVAALLRGDPDLSQLYRTAFGAPLPANDEVLLVDAGKALAAYLETLVSARTPFDDFRDALARRRPAIRCRRSAVCGFLSARAAARAAMPARASATARSTAAALPHCSKAARSTADARAQFAICWRAATTSLAHSATSARAQRRSARARRRTNRRRRAHSVHLACAR